MVITALKYEKIWEKGWKMVIEAVKVWGISVIFHEILDLTVNIGLYTETSHQEERLQWERHGNTREIVGWEDHSTFSGLVSKETLQESSVL